MFCVHTDTALGLMMQYTYLGHIITVSGSFSMAVNALKEKACRALYTIKRKFHKINIPITLWCKIFDSIIQPILLYGSEVWGPLSMCDYTTWDYMQNSADPFYMSNQKHPTMHVGQN